MSTTLYFNNLSSALLYRFELEGQISDGKYENSRPYNHWRWVTDVKIVVDTKHRPMCSEGRRWFLTSKKYNLNEWPGLWKKGHNWAFRAMQYIRLGKVFESTQENYNKLANVYEIRSAVSDFPVEKPSDYNTIKAIAEERKCPQWFIDMIDEDFCNKFYDGTATAREISKAWKEAHESMKQTVNSNSTDYINL